MVILHHWVWRESGTIVLVWHIFFLDRHDVCSWLVLVEVEAVTTPLVLVLGGTSFWQKRRAVRLLSGCLDCLVIRWNFNVLWTRVGSLPVSTIKCSVVGNWVHLIIIIFLHTFIWRQVSHHSLEIRCLTLIVKSHSSIIDPAGLVAAWPLRAWAIRHSLSFILKCESARTDRLVLEVFRLDCYWVWRPE